MDYTRLKALATELGVKPDDVIALSHKNDPFYVGTDRQLAMAKWFAGIWQEKGFTGRGGVHLRRAHYQLLGNAKHDGKQSTMGLRSWSPNYHPCRMRTRRTQTTRTGSSTQGATTWTNSRTTRAPRTWRR